MPSFKFDCIDERVVEKAINSLQNNSYCGYDEIPDIVIKDVKWKLLKILAYLINSFCKWKISPVT